MGNTQHTGRRCAVGVTSALLIALGVSGCASSEEKSSAATATDAVVPAETVAAEALAGDIALTSGGADAATVSPAGFSLEVASPFGSALAIEAGVAIEVDDVRKTVLALPTLVDDQGGAIFDTNIAVGDPSTAVATVTVKVPPAQLESLIAGLGGLGELVGRTQQTEDVADQIADTEARIQTAQASVDRVRELLKVATDLDAVVRIESELTIRETNLERLLASQRNLDDRVQLATLTILITPSPVDKPAAVAVEQSNGIGDALGKGWNAFVDVLHGFAVVVAYSAPFLVIGLILLGAGWLVRRRWPRHAVPTRAVAEPTI